VLKEFFESIEKGKEREVFAKARKAMEKNDLNVRGSGYSLKSSTDNFGTEQCIQLSVVSAFCCGRLVLRQ
jgi:hypothetical protein